MAFNDNNKSTNQNKNQFVGSLRSHKSDKVTAWVNLVDSFVMATFKGAKSVKDITAQEVEEKLTDYYSNDYVYFHVTDLTAEIETTTPEEY